MRRIWYGDKRDLLKWSVVADIVTKNSIASVVYVPFLPGDDERVGISFAVWNHFKGLDGLYELVKGLGATLFPLWRPFYPPLKREDYFKEVLELARTSEPPRLVLLDPDTGLAPATAGRSHVKLPEVKMVWEALTPLDWLAVYQHRLRVRDWDGQLQVVKSRLEDSLQGTARVDIRRGNGVALDAAILLVEGNRDAV